MNRVWTEEDMALARKLYAEHQSFVAVAKIMGRNKQTVNDWLSGARGGGANRVKVIKNEAMCIPPEVLQDRERRYQLMMTVDPVKLMLGEPLPGYSALERR